MLARLWHWLAEWPLRRSIARHPAGFDGRLVHHED